MEWLIPAVFGAMGSYFPRGGGAGYPDPDGWPPVYCPVCGLVIGAIGAVVINVLAGASIAEAGFFATATASVAGGSVLNAAVAGLAKLARGNKG